MDATQPFEIRVERRGSDLHLMPAGEIDMATAPRLAAALAARDDAVTRVVLDLREVGFMDTSGLQVLIAGNRELEAAGVALVLVRGPEAVQRLLAMAGLTERLRIVDAPGGSAPGG